MSVPLDAAVAACRARENAELLGQVMKQLVLGPSAPDWARTSANSEASWLVLTTEPPNIYFAQSLRIGDGHVRGRITMNPATASRSWITGVTLGPTMRTINDLRPRTR